MECKRCAVVKVLRDAKAKIEADERYHYEPANVEVNAPLALIQTGMEMQVRLCDKALAALDGGGAEGG